MEPEFSLADDSTPADCTGAAIDTLAVDIARLPGLRPTLRRVTRDLETNHPRLYPAIKHDHRPPGKGLACDSHKVTGALP
jgi:hypothetical protein